MRTGSLLCTALLLPWAVVFAAPPTTVTARRWSFTARAWWTGGRLTGSQQDIDERVSGVQRTLDGDVSVAEGLCRRRVDEVPDAVSLTLSDPLFCLGLVEVITEWRNGFGRTPSPGHRGTHTRWSVIARCRSQWFARESIVIIHHFSCIHITCCILCLLCFTPAWKIAYHRYRPYYWPRPTYDSFTGLSLAISSPAATDTSSPIRCLLQRRRPAKAESCKCKCI